MPTHNRKASGAWTDELIGRLRTAMSPPAMLDILRRDWHYLRLGDEILDCQVVRVFPRGDGFVLHYEITLRSAGWERIQPLFGELTNDPPECRRQDAVKRLRKPKRQPLPEEIAADRMALLPVPGMVLCFPERDERLLGLKLIHNPSLLRSLLSQHLAIADADLAAIEPAILAHRLGRRCITRIRFEQRLPQGSARSRGSVIAKLYRSRTDRGRQVFAAMQRLWAGGFGAGSSLTIPNPIAYLADGNVLLMEDVPGTPLPDLPAPSVLDGMAASGRMLAKLHRSAVVVPRRHTVDDEIALLTHWVALVGRVYPELDAIGSEALRRIRASLHAHRDARTTLVHRDVYEKQILLTSSRATLLDFDTLCMADPALDLGNFLAHLQLTNLQGLTPLQGPAEAFLDGYRRVSGSAANDRICIYTRSSLLRLGCLHAFRPRWRHLAEVLMESCLTSARSPL